MGNAYRFPLHIVNNHLKVKMTSDHKNMSINGFSNSKNIRKLLPLGPMGPRRTLTGACSIWGAPWDPRGLISPLRGVFSSFVVLFPLFFFAIDFSSSSPTSAWRYPPLHRYWLFPPPIFNCFSLPKALSSGLSSIRKKTLTKYKALNYDHYILSD